jgi:cellulose synthase/poly-beta-1,6-N-acetylglucosamine synthase-like glycosyltransferase
LQRSKRAIQNQVLVVKYVVFIYFVIILLQQIISFAFVFWVAMLLVELGYWLFVFSRLFFFKIGNNNTFRHKHKKQYEEKITNTPMISVVICGRNEALNFKKNLPFILTQRYPNFEVIVVNDASTDDSALVLNGFVESYPHLLRIVHIEKKTSQGKKAALSKGIGAAKGDFLLITDADCAPPSIDWVSGMVAPLSKHQNIEIVLGYAPCRHVQSGFLNSFITFETLWTAIQYLGFAQAGMPYMGVGRNLLYKKSLFQQVNGFEKHADLASGDDDLFVNSVSNRQNTTICLDAQTFMWSDPKTTWEDYRRQKQRHLSAGTRYQFWHQIVLGGIAAAQFFSWFLPLMLIFFNFSMIFVAIILVIRLILVTIFYGLTIRKLHIGENKFYFFVKLPLLDLFFIIFYSTFAAISIVHSLYHQFIHKTQKNIYWK